MRVCVLQGDGLQRVLFIRSGATRCAPHTFCQPKTHRLWRVFLGHHGKIAKNASGNPWVSTLPVAVGEKSIGLTLFLAFFDRGHSLSSLYPPQAARPKRAARRSTLGVKRKVGTVQHFRPGKMKPLLRGAEPFVISLPADRAREVKEPLVPCGVLFHLSFDDERKVADGGRTSWQYGG